MKLAIFGATGRTGTLILDEALGAGHSVTAVVRNPNKLQSPASPALRIAVTDAMSPTKVAAEIAEVDAVISTIGSPGREPSTVMTDSVRSLVEAMRSTGRKRLVVVSGSMVDTTGDGFLLRRVGKPIARRVFRGAYEDMQAAEAVIHRSDLLWTIMRPPRLTDGPGIGSCRTAIDTNVPGANTLCRSDLARATIATLDDPATIRHHVFLAPGRR